MADGTTVEIGHPEPAVAPRSRGRIDLSVVAPLVAGGQTRLDRLHHGGCLKVLFPDTGDAALTAITLNTGGGLTGGDRIETEAEARGGHLVVSTQTAERIYQAQHRSEAEVRTRLSVAKGARLDWVPQETILFDQSALRRDLDVGMAADATFLMVEPLVLGRRAMGERVHQVCLRDRVRLHRDGKLIFADGLRLNGDAEAWTLGPATGGGATSMALVLFAAPTAESLLTDARAILGAAKEAIGGATLIDDRLIAARIVAHDSFTLRRVLVPLLTLLGNAPLPRTWTL